MKKHTVVSIALLLVFFAFVFGTQLLSAKAQGETTDFPSETPTASQTPAVTQTPTLSPTSTTTPTTAADLQYYFSMPESEDPNIPWGTWYIKEDLKYKVIDGVSRQAFALCYPSNDKCDNLIHAYCLEEATDPPTVGQSCFREGTLKFNCDVVVFEEVKVEKIDEEQDNGHRQPLKVYAVLKRLFRAYMPLIKKEPKPTPTPTPCPNGCPDITLFVESWDYQNGSWVKHEDQVQFGLNDYNQLSRVVRSWQSHPATVTILYKGSWDGTYFPNLKKLTLVLYGPNGEVVDISARDKVKDLKYDLTCDDINNSLQNWTHTLDAEIQTACGNTVCKSKLLIVDPLEPVVNYLVMKEGKTVEDAKIQAEKLVIDHMNLYGVTLEQALQALSR